MMCPPVAPSAGILAERRAGNGMQSRVNEVLRRRLDRIVVQKIEQLRNGGQALLTREHTGPREVAGRAFANSFGGIVGQDRKSTRLNSSHVEISYAVFCLKKKKKK